MKTYGLLISLALWITFPASAQNEEQPVEETATVEAVTEETEEASDGDQPTPANGEQIVPSEVATEDAAAEAPAEAPQGRRGVEKLQVTGSYIRRTDVEGPSPILVIDSETIKKTGVNSVSAVLNRSTVSPFGGSDSSVSLKGLGSGRTLVLINGQRAPSSGSSYGTGAVSTDFVPIAAVERIEVLKDGASATYGADALGGVINIITKKDLDGFAAATKYDVFDFIGSNVSRSSLAYGSQTADSNFMTSLQVTHQQGTRSSSRDYLKDLNKDFRFSSNYVNDAGDVAPNPNCVEINEDGRCETAISPQQISDPSLGVDLVTEYSYNLDSDTQIYTTVIAGYERSGGSFPNVLNTPGETLGVSFTGAETPASWDTLPGYSGGDTRVWHNMEDYVNQTLDQSYYGSLVLGIKGYYGDSNWEWDITANNQISIQESSEENLATVSGTRAAMIADTYNPWDPTKRNTSGLGTDAFLRNRSVVNWFEFKSNGELGNFAGFDWSSAVGASMAHFEYADHRPDSIVSGDVMLQSGVVGKGARELYSLFAEFSGTVASQFELQFSVRGDVYSDFGSTVNPKLAARYQPTNWLALRSSVGTGFQAPTLQNMNAKIQGYDFLVDQVRCKDPALGNGDTSSPECRNQSVSVFQDNNADLKQETSIAYNVGAIVQPTKNFTASVDWWLVEINDTIGAQLRDIMLLEERDPTAPQRYGVNLIREGGSPTGQLNRIEYQLFNVGNESATGVDLELQYVIPLAGGRSLVFKNETTYMGAYKRQFYEEFGEEQVLGRFGRPRWRNNFTASYSSGAFGAQLVARSVADMERDGRELGKIVSPTQYDTTLTFDPSWAGEFQLGAINLFNIRPRFDDTNARKINTAVFRGYQTFFLGYRQDF